ncbi:MAG: FAD-dependent oxidoreductase [Acidimicrobiia bacterium]|nr:FAD-dependent oxidoreductase [Acidimicrobiia bacterium]
MAQSIPRHHADVLVVGGGAGGVAASIAARENGASVLLLERGSAVGGELIGGLPFLGTANALGQPIVGGPLDILLDKCRDLDGYVGRPFDGRLMYGTMVDPEAMKLAVVEALAERRIRTLVGTSVDDVVIEGREVRGVIAHTKGGPTLFTGDVIVDSSGDADVVTRAGGEVLKGDEKGTLQPVTLVFRMSHVEFPVLLEFIRDNPDEFTLAENPVIEKTPAECAADIHASGHPFAMMQGERPGSLLSDAIEAGSMYQTTGIWMWPTSMQRQELGFNTTRISGVDGTDSFAIADALSQLTTQVQQAMTFLRRNVPGFKGAHLSGVAPRVGVRETRRIKGDAVLQTEDVLAGKKHPDGIARGGHHVDIHGAGTYQKRVPVRGGMSYDIPYGTLIPAGFDNVVVAGRCLSSERDANGSARVIGTAMAMGQAAGTAAAMAVAEGSGSLRAVPVVALRESIDEQGGVISGTN